MEKKICIEIKTNKKEISAFMYYQTGKRSMYCLLFIVKGYAGFVIPGLSVYIVISIKFDCCFGFIFMPFLYYIWIKIEFLMEIPLEVFKWPLKWLLHYSFALENLLILFHDFPEISDFMALVYC